MVRVAGGLSTIKSQILSVWFVGWRRLPAYNGIAEAEVERRLAEGEIDAIAASSDVSPDALKMRVSHSSECARDGLHLTTTMYRNCALKTKCSPI